MVTTRRSREYFSMRTKRLVSIIGSALLVLSPTAWAADHAGGGGGGGDRAEGGGGGGGGGSGGHAEGGGDRADGEGARPSGGFRGGGPGFRSGFSRGMTNSAMRQSRTFGRAEFNRRIASHIAERHDANWHSDWDRRHVHFDHHRFFVFVDGFWCGLDPGFFPWDYYPYYAYDYYPYDYYPRYYADVEPNYYSDNTYSNEPMSDPTVTAVQTQLTQLGYYSGPVDGIFGPTTRDAVAKYQIANNLDVTGSLSADTLQSLGLPQPMSS